MLQLSRKSKYKTQMIGYANFYRLEWQYNMPFFFLIAKYTWY